MGFLLRWLFALLLVVLTFNPTPLNYVSWGWANAQAQLPLVALLGLLLLVGWIVYLGATLRSIGVFGMALVLAVVGALLWVLFDQGLLTLANQELNLWIGILALSLVLAIGMSWSILWRRLSGQVDVDETEP